MESGNKSNSIRIADVVGVKVNVNNNIKREASSKVKAAVASSTVKTPSCAATATVSSTVKDAKPGKERARFGAQKASSSSSPSSSSASSSSSLAGKTAGTKVCPAKDEARASSSSSAAANASIAAVISSSSAGSSSSIADQSFTAADSNSNIPSKSQAACKVCGDKASGYHYGVTSCEGCKGFFRRSIQKQIEYRCLRDGKCIIIRLNRNRCQFCRFRKCLAVGMSRDSVRYGRVPKRPKEKTEERVTQAEADQSEKDSENKQVATYDIILTISNAHHAHCCFTEERLTGLIKKPAQFNLGEVDLNEDTAQSLEQQRLIIWEQFALHVTPSVQPIVEFAKKVPGFHELGQDDQLILIKSGFFEIWLVQICRMLDPTANTLTFSDGSCVSTQPLDLVFDHDFISSIFAFGVAFNNLHLNDTEIGIVCAIVLLTTDRVGLTDTKFLRQQQDNLREALRCQLNRHHPSDINLLTNLLEKLPELRTIGNKHNEHLKWFRVQWSCVKLPPLFAEIFDIPKYDERL